MRQGLSVPQIVIVQNLHKVITGHSGHKDQKACELEKKQATRLIEWLFTWHLNFAVFKNISITILGEYNWPSPEYPLTLLERILMTFQLLLQYFVNHVVLFYYLNFFS